MRTKPCEKCKAEAILDSYCGAWVCTCCGHHNGLARCYCGWSLSGEDGRKELTEMGETIEEEG